jgi:hypothetical protein
MVSRRKQINRPAGPSEAKPKGVALSRGELAQHLASLITADRNVTHGDPHLNGSISDAIVTALEAGPAWPHLHPTLRWVLRENANKQARLVCGLPIQDHLIDIAGYSLIGAEVCDKPLTK